MDIDRLDRFAPVRFLNAPEGRLAASAWDFEKKLLPGESEGIDRSAGEHRACRRHEAERTSYLMNARLV